MCSSSAIIDEHLHDLGRSLVEQAITTIRFGERYTVGNEILELRPKGREIFERDATASRNGPEWPQERIYGANLRRNDARPVVVKLP